MQKRVDARIAAWYIYFDMTVVEKEIQLLELEIAKLKVESNAPQNDGWMTDHYKKELDKANEVHSKKVAELENASKKKTNREEHIGIINDQALLADGFADALIGYDNSSMVAVYDYEKCCDILMDRDAITYEDAHEYMQFNVINAVIGDYMPSFISLFNNMK